MCLKATAAVFAASSRVHKLIKECSLPSQYLDPQSNVTDFTEFATVHVDICSFR